MGFAPGSKLGPYQILSEIGAGGMGVVYRARDARLAREVAIKVLPEQFAHDPERVRRFELEAQAAGTLNHPNIVSVFDVGNENGLYYVVTELLHGETLRAVLKHGALPARKLVPYAEQLALGMAAAHSKNIVHRDIKPENIFVTTDDRIKILDFGLAKLDVRAESAGPENATVTVMTEPGTLLGSARYMSPEQTRAEPLDARSDIFSFGAVLYEMCTGKAAFPGRTSVESMTAILRDNPVLELSPEVPDAIEEVVRQCLEKKRENRFQSAQDLAFTLKTLSRPSTQARLTSLPKEVSRRRWLPLLIGAPLVAATAGAYYLGRVSVPTTRGEFRRITYRRGYVTSARFSPDGQTIIYSADWDGEGVKVYSGRPDRPEYRALDLPPAYVLSISSKSEMALLSSTRARVPMEREGTLSVAPLAGGAPRELIQRVQSADWSPDGSELAVVRPLDRYRLEFPAGKNIYETDGKIADPRVSPDGKVIAFIDQPRFGDDAGYVAIIDRNGQRKRLSRDWRSCQGLAWSAKGDEVFFTAATIKGGRQLYAVSMSGKERTLAAEPNRILLHDVARDGSLLLTHESYRYGILSSQADGKGERDVSWLDAGQLSDIAPDGKAILFSEGGAAVSGTPLAYLRRTRDSQPVQLGAGQFPALSPDGAWVACLAVGAQGQLILIPTGAGQSRRLPQGELARISYVRWRNSREVVFSGVSKGKPSRIYVQDIDGGLPRVMSEEGFGLCAAPLTPDGRACVGCSNGQSFLLPFDGGQRRLLPSIVPGEEVIAFSPDGKIAYVQVLDSVPARVDALEIATAKRSPWKTFAPVNTAGLTGIGPLSMAPDLKSYAYNYESVLSDLFVLAEVV